MTDLETKEAIRELWQITAALAHICERNGMSNLEAEELSGCFERLSKVMKDGVS